MLSSGLSLSMEFVLAGMLLYSLVTSSFLIVEPM